jgi:hypothetical protein
MQKRFAERKVEPLMESAMIQESKNQVIIHGRRAIAYRRVALFMIILSLALSVALAATVYTAVETRKIAEKCGGK